MWTTRNTRNEITKISSSASTDAGRQKQKKNFIGSKAGIQFEKQLKHCKEENKMNKRRRGPTNTWSF